MKNSKPHRDELKSKLPDMLSMIVSVWIFLTYLGLFTKLLLNLETAFKELEWHLDTRQTLAFPFSHRSDALVSLVVDGFTACFPFTQYTKISSFNNPESHAIYSYCNPVTRQIWYCTDLPCSCLLMFLRVNCRDHWQWTPNPWDM